VQNSVYVVNDLSEYFKVTYNGKSYIFLADKPVKIDYEDDPRFVSYLLQFTQLRLATVNEIQKAGLIPAQIREEQNNEKINKPSTPNRSK